MIEATLCLLIDETPPGRILLGRKKRGFGVGKLNGFGGKVLPEETSLQAVVREVHEETGLILSPETLRAAGWITFTFPSAPSYDHHVHLFVAASWEGEARETAEMAPAWFPLREIPYREMWNDDGYWLPTVLAGNRIRASFSFDEDNETVRRWSVETL